MIGKLPLMLLGLGVVGAAAYADRARSSNLLEQTKGRKKKSVSKIRASRRQSISPLPGGESFASVKPTVSPTVEAYKGDEPQAMTAVNLIEQAGTAASPSNVFGKG